MGIWRPILPVAGVLLLLACGGDDDEKKDYPAAQTLRIEPERGGTLDGDVRFQLNSDLRLNVATSETKMTEYCDRDDRFGCNSGDSCPKEKLKVYPETHDVQAEVSHATCEGCSVTVDPSKRAVVLRATQRGTAKLTVTMNKLDGSGAISKTFELRFDEAKKIAVTRERYVSPGSSSDVFVADSLFAWCATPKTEDDRVVSGANMTLTAEGSVEKTDRSEGKCPVFHATTAGKGTLTFKAGDVTRSIPIEVVPLSDVASVDLLDALRLGSPDTLPSIEDEPLKDRFPLESILVRRPEFAGTCSLGVVGRFTTKDGRFGVTPRTAVTWSPKGALYDNGVMNPARSSLVFFRNDGALLASLTVTLGTATKTIGASFDPACKDN